MLDLTLVVVAKDDADLAAFDARACGEVDLRLVNNQANESLARIANRHLEDCRKVFGLCHADVAFLDGSLKAFMNEASTGSVCGLVGIDLEGIYHSSYSKFTEWGIAGPGPVSTLDAMGVFFRWDLGLRFDEKTFDGYHCHVEDLCLQAAARGIPIAVPAAEAH